MRKFKFNLEPLFEYRQRLEEISHKEFGESLERLKDEERRIEELKELYLKSSHEIDSLKETGAGRQEMELYHSYMSGLKRHISEQDRILVQVSAVVERKRGELIEASKNRKVIELMKERSLSSYNKRMDKVEQKESDELVTARFGRNGNDEK
ncbi:MAG TPA: flagellar export protein FliJ [Deltaproteobacteria bacterium]|nr:MAG: flagellar export protein FliJ [Deltaproteobacteria bacterium GWA2_55_82]OIJ72830.1 MAG: flagellar export protein FliJ [Deltaproteobacteria bacterium GWC2_55_46]HBG46109.1 flagellar export protein FliJ [Deltaproteobacteria bacterium]HCY11607.1 flagellar export protein FliJ [Deltaproteobacteria bacterium]